MTYESLTPPFPDLQITSSSLQVVLKVREISVYGHAKDSYELYSSMGEHVSQEA